MSSSTGVKAGRARDFLVARMTRSILGLDRACSTLYLVLATKQLPTEICFSKMPLPSVTDTSRPVDNHTHASTHIAFVIGIP